MPQTPQTRCSINGCSLPAGGSMAGSPQRLQKRFFAAGSFGARAICS